MFVAGIPHQLIWRTTFHTLRGRRDDGVELGQRIDDVQPVALPAKHTTRCCASQRVAARGIAHEIHAPSDAVGLHEQRIEVGIGHPSTGRQGDRRVIRIGNGSLVETCRRIGSQRLKSSTAPPPVRKPQVGRRRQLRRLPCSLSEIDACDQRPPSVGGERFQPAPRVRRSTSARPRTAASKARASSLRRTFPRQRAGPYARPRLRARSARAVL